MKIVMPLFIEIWVNKKRKIAISLNIYRNLHFQVSNNIKKLYKNEVKHQLSLLWEIKLEPPISIVIKYYNPTKRLSDIENQCSIHCKFFQDALVELWYIEDDNYKFIDNVSFQYGWYDKNNGRVEITII